MTAVMVLGVIFVGSGVVLLIFSRQLEERAQRRHPSPEVNAPEGLKVFRIRVAGFIATGLVMAAAGFLRR